MDAVLAGGRPNAISGGQNAFAGVVNPANAVWVEDRFDIGAFWVHQRFSLDNKDNNPLLPFGKIDLSYKAKNLLTADVAVHKQFKLMCYDSSLSLAFYATPSHVKIRTKIPFPSSGTTPIFVEDKVQVASVVFSFKYNMFHSIGCSLDCFRANHCRRGYQRADNPLRSVSPGHVTNNGYDHSFGIGFSFGWRWNINKRLTFGFAFVKKSYIGQYRKYRGYEPHHAKNYIPETIGMGFSFIFTKKVAGRLEVLWTNLRNMPGANNNVLSNGRLNLNRRGSNKSPGPGLQDATFINLGIGYNVSPMLSFGMGYSHRIKLRRSSNIISHTYALQTIYDVLSVGVNYNYHHNDFFLTFSHGFQNRTSGYFPKEFGGGKLIAKRGTNALSIAWGYLY
jgi:long-chain fatty acid transport protein